MHEFPITQQILKIAEDTARIHGAVGVSRITIVVGELSGFIGESIQMYFDVLAEESVAKGAALEIVSVKSELTCKMCNSHFDWRRFLHTCPVCGERGEFTRSGSELYVKDIELL